LKHICIIKIKKPKQMKKFLLLCCVNLAIFASASAQCVSFTASQAGAVSVYSFTASGTFNPVASAIYWDFGNGATGFGATVVHQFSTFGVTVVDSTMLGCSGTFCDSVIIGSNGNCGVSLNGGVAGSAYQIAAIPTGQAPFNYTWSTNDANNGATASVVSGPMSATVNTYCVQITDALGCMATNCTTLVNPSSGCTANFVSYQDSLQPGTFYFTNLSNGSNLSYQWSFGDNTSSTLMNPTHTFATPGIYFACLSIYDQTTGCTDSLCINVMYSNGSNCPANISVYDSAGTYYFFANSQGVAPFTYAWTSPFGPAWGGNNYYATASGLAAGTYTVCVEITDANGCVSNACYTLSVSGNPACDADFYIFPDSMVTGLYYAVNQSTGNNPSYLWDFGDGNTSTQAFPTHVYAQPGTYVICLTVTAPSFGAICTDTHCDSTYIVLRTASGPISELRVLPGVTGLNSISVNESLLLYPNPANDILKFDTRFKEGSFEIYDLTGRVIASNSNLEIGFIQIAELKAGSYIIKLKLDNQIFFNQFVKN
jgi:PKD repeat protein